jgi:aminopeptidase N
VPDVDQATANFDAITYYKGMSVLRQLHAYLGEEAFEAGLRDYFRDHAWSNTVLSDLMDAFGAAAGIDLTSWTDAWLDHAGTDVIALDDARTTVTVTSPDGNAPRPHRFDIASFAADGSLIATTEVTTPASPDGPATLAVELPEAAAHLLNAGDLTFASVRPDAASQAWLSEHAGELPDTMSRVLAGLAAWDGLVRGTIGGPEAIATLLSVLHTERRPEIVESLLGLAAAAAERWTPPADVERERAAVAAAAYTLADEPALEGPALRTLASHATEPEQFARVEAAGEDNIELAWRLLGRRAELGEYDADAVAALQERDSDPDAWVSALAVDAARDDADAKERAWQTIMVEAKVPVGDPGFRAMAAFWRPGQEEVLAPYGERYLEAVKPLAGGMLSAGPRLNGMFPSVGAGEEFLEASRAAAADPAVAPMVRQNLLRTNDSLERQLKARGLA